MCFPHWLSLYCGLSEFASPCVGFLIRALLRSLHCPYQCCVGKGCRFVWGRVVAFACHTGLSKLMWEHKPFPSQCQGPLDLSLFIHSLFWPTLGDLKSISIDTGHILPQTASVNKTVSPQNNFSFSKVVKFKSKRMKLRVFFKCQNRHTHTHTFLLY